MSEGEVPEGMEVGSCGLPVVRKRSAKGGDGTERARRTGGSKDGLLQALAPERKRGDLACQDLGGFDLAAIGASAREERDQRKQAGSWLVSHSLVLIIPLDQDLSIQLYTCIDSFALAIAPYRTRRSVDTRLQEVTCASGAESDVDLAAKREARVRERLDGGLSAEDEDDVIDLWTEGRGETRARR
jgi:hypothetical protein